MYVQVYLFIILYSYWIATNIIQYLLYLVMLVSEYLSVFTQLYLRKWGQLLYQRIMQPFFRNTRTFHGVYSTSSLHESHESPFSGQGNPVDLGLELNKMENSLESVISKMSALETIIGTSTRGTAKSAVACRLDR